MNPRLLSVSRFALFAAIVAVGSFASSAMAEEPKFVPLFNGKDFTGWKLPEPNLNWSVREGVLVGNSEEKLRGSNLWTVKSYGNFILDIDVKCEGPEIDTGVDLRTPSFQLQMGVSRSLKRDMTGSWLTDGKGDPTRYPESGRANDWEKYFKAGDWNTFRIEARGNTFTAWLNGHKISQYTSDRYAQPGPIGLQFHDTLKMKLGFRNIRIAEL